MDEHKAITFSYADIVKGQATPVVMPKQKLPSWFDQIEESTKMSRSNSLSTVMSDDTIDTRTNVQRHSISHSVDSGQISDMSSDNEICQKWHSVTDLNDEPRKQKVKYASHRRTSVDSCGTTSSITSTCCMDSNCSSDHNQLKLMCQQRWRSIKKMQNMERETDEGVLARRQKQIDYGKSTIGYEIYTKQVKIDQRTEDHPKTPKIHKKYSRRAFDGLIKIWRKELHKFDPDCAEKTDEQTPDEETPNEEN